jgi:hypothetical protein
MKQSNELARLRIKACDFGTFIAITMRTRESKIGGHGFPLMLPGYDVVYLERQWKSRLGNTAVLATLARSLSNRASSRFTVALNAVPVDQTASLRLHNAQQRSYMQITVKLLGLSLR